MYLINKYSNRFHIPGEYLKSTDLIKHRIITTDDTPTVTKQYRFPLIHKEKMTRQVNELLENKIIKHSDFPYNIPIWIVPKKSDSQGNKKWRLVLDFRKLNERTVGQFYPLPNIIDLFDQLGNAQYFSVFDLSSGFHQIKIDPRDAYKTAFSTQFGHYEFNRIPFGFKNSQRTNYLFI